MKEELKKVITKYREVIPREIIKRDLVLPETKLSKALVLVGPRRAGKSFFLYNLYNQEVNPVFINFEDGLISNIKGGDLNYISEASKELYGLKNFSFFFDEIQNIPKWENFIVSLLNSNYKIFITGSNSKLLSKEIATSLRGKSLSYLFLPLSFKEFLWFNNINLVKNWQYKDNKFGVKTKFKEFFKFGGFPEVVLSESLELKNKLLNSYFEAVLYKDLQERLKSKNSVFIKITLKYLLNLFGNRFSITSFENYLKTNKIKYSLGEIYPILQASEDVFFCSFLRQYKKSFKKTEFSKSKVYLFDQGYIHFLARENEDKGRILENLVFVELFRRNNQVENENLSFFISKDNKECDFIFKQNEIFQATQVCYNLNEDNKSREVEGLLGAIKFFKLKEGLILTFDQEAEFEVEGKKIIVKPVWKWLLENS